MLQCFYKYSYTNKFKNIININYNYKLTKKNNNYFYSNTILNIYSLFFRKAHFRSLITYINILYSNVDQPNISDHFYIPKYVISTNINTHPGFLFKKHHLK